MKSRFLAAALCALLALGFLMTGAQGEVGGVAQGELTYADFIDGSKVFAVQSGDIYELFVREAGWCSNPLLLQNFPEIAEAVRMDRADVAMMTEDAVPELRDSGAYDDFAFLPVPRDVIEIRVAPVFKDAALAEQFNAFLNEIKDNGILNEMGERYLNGMPDYADIPKIELTGLNGTLKVADTGSYPPMAYVGEDNEVLGYDIELSQRFAQYLGMDIEIQLMAYDGILPSVVSGNTDMSACCYVITEERQEGAIFSDAVMQLGAVLAAKRPEGAVAPAQGDDAVPTATYEDFVGKRFSIMVGSLFDGVADRVFDAAEKLYFNNTVEEIEAVRLGKTDAALLDDVSAAQALQTGEYSDLIAIPVTRPELDLPYGVFSTRRDIIDQYNEFLAEIEADGTLAEMQNRWLHSYAFTAVMPEIPLTKENGTLKVAIMATYPPFTFAGEGGEFTGFDIEQMRRFAAWLGMDVEFADMDFGALLAYVGSGKADIGGSVYATDERKESFAFGNPDYTSKTVLVVRREDAGMVAAADASRDHADFVGKTVGVDIGSIGETLVAEIGGVAAQYQDMTTGIEDVRNGRIDGYASDLSSSRLLVNEQGNEDLEVVPIPASFFSAPMGAIASFDNQALVDEFNAFLGGLKADGALEEMQGRWFEGVPDVDAPMPELNYSGEKGVLKVATGGNEVPFDYYGEGRELKGYVIELMNRFAAFAGYTVEYMTMDFGAQIPAVVGGRADMAISSISITEERKKSVLFTDSIFDDQFCIIALKQAEDAVAAEDTGFIAWLKNAVERNLIVENRWRMIVDGLGVTMTISLLAQGLGTVLGCLLCWVLTRKNRLASGLGRLYSGLIHGLPMVVLLMISYYIIFGKSNVPAMLIAVCAFALVEAAAVAENLKGAIDTVDPVEIEAARSIGFSAVAAFRVVTLPQAIKRALPAYCNGFIELVKATAIVGYIAIQDMTRAGDIIRSRTYDAFFPLLLVAAIYLLVTSACVQLFKWIVKKIGKEVR